MKLSRIIFLFFLIAMAIGAFIFYPKVELYFAGIKTIDIDKKQSFYVHTGANLDQVVDSLVAKKIIT
ncbi:MAG: aminodeoxychorismate lyase, partial [Flavobacteriales bacterium]